MITFHVFLTSALCIGLVSSIGLAQDLADYHGFRFGMNIESVATQVQMSASEAKTSHDRPALIQTLQWNQVSYSEPAAKSTSVRGIRFDFYNGELFKMVITYDPASTDGLTADDIMEAISALYGTASKPEDFVSVSNSTTYRDQEKVLARWEDPQYSYNLFRSSYGNSFGLVASSKALDLLASNSIREADRLDKLEAPAKELARRKKQAEDARTAQETARSVNKPKFRP